MPRVHPSLHGQTARARSASRPWEKRAPGWVRRGFVTLVAVALAAAAPRMPAAAGSRAELVALLRPDRIGQVELAPDGRHIAYTVREGAVLSLVIRALDRPGTKATVFADTDVEEGFLHRTLTFTIRLPFVGWADAGTLVYFASLPPHEGQFREELHAVDVDGRNNRV
ncbi:MAG TPA: hypothetical protein VHE61_23555, partial [Opitutaceae bacterium]|nr:hypothetical protein [Opitutaceae bacterium]